MAPMTTVIPMAMVSKKINFALMVILANMVNAPLVSHPLQSKVMLSHSAGSAAFTV
jgi:hypothetical protein